MLNKSSSKAGFTLLEILIAVLIIGVLSSVALPLYRGAIDKSRWSKLLAPARAVATAQEAAYMSQGGYTANIDDLDISLPEGGDMTYTLYTTANGDDANFVRIASSNLDNVRLARYYKKNEGFEDQLYCEAKNGNERANKLCGKLLEGQELISTEDDYKMYLIGEKANEVLCNRMNLWWSNNFTNCYLTEEKRCTDNNMPYGGGLCGWTNTNGKTINEGGICEGSGNYACQNSIVNDGGTCGGDGVYSCNGSTINSGGECAASVRRSCQSVTVNEGGVCIAGAGDRSCNGSTINAGGECIANEESSQACGSVKLYGGKCSGKEGSSWACMGVEIYDGGICEGNVGRASNSSCYRPNVYDGGKCLGDAQAACSLGNFYEGGVCEGNSASSCKSSPAQGGSFESGSVCNGRVAQSCAGNFQSGSVCHGYAANSCSKLDNNYKAFFHAGSRCVAHVAGACKGTYDEGACCEGGDNCPATAPRC